MRILLPVVFLLVLLVNDSFWFALVSGLFLLFF